MRWLATVLPFSFLQVESINHSNLCRYVVLLCDCVTFLNIMSEPTDSAVNRAAISNMMMPTGILVFRPVKAAIHPLAKQNNDNVSEFQCTPVEVQNQ